MFKSGLVSISFRDKSPEEIIAACAECGLSAVEWGSEIHVPAGKLEIAAAVREACAEDFISVSSYGSYYRLGRGNTRVFESVLLSARELSAPVIRIWAGEKASEEITFEEEEFMAAECRELCGRAKDYGVTLALECHPYTLTDDYMRTDRFLERVNAENLKTYWQPNQFKSEGYNINAARVLAENTVNLHVFTWTADRRYPLCEGEESWLKYLQIFAATGNDINLLLEFMHDNDIASLYNTAKTLNGWIEFFNRR